MRLRAASIVIVAACALGLPGCAFENEEFQTNLADKAAPKRTEAPSPEIVVPAPDKSGLGGVPVVGPMLAALFGAEALPEDEETAVPLAKAGRGAGRIQSAALTEGRAVDRQPPRLDVHFVRNGRLRAYTSRFTVRGTGTDESPVALVTVNGHRARLRGRGFSRRIAVPVGAQRTVVQALDAHGNAALVQFDIIRRGGRDGGAPAPIGPGSTELRAPRSPPRQIRGLGDIEEPGIYMVLWAGTPAMHAVRMPGMAHCLKAAEYSAGGTCTIRR